MPFFHQARPGSLRQVAHVGAQHRVLQRQTLVPGAMMMTDMIAVARVVADPTDLSEGPRHTVNIVIGAGGQSRQSGFRGRFSRRQWQGRPRWCRGRSQNSRRPFVEGQSNPARGKICHRQEADPCAGRCRPRPAGCRQCQCLPARYRRCAGFQPGVERRVRRLCSATVITPTSKPGFAIEDSRIEINLVATTERHVRRVDGGRGSASPFARRNRQRSIAVTFSFSPA